MKILIVDDELLMLQLLSRIFEQDKHEVICAKDGIEAIRIFKEQQIDLVITDIVMPRKNGIELIHEILEKKPNTPIIAMSGNLFLVSPADLLRISGVLNKPFTIQQLQEFVAPIIANVK